MPEPTPEILHGLKVSETEVTIAVTSNGCTDREDFDLIVKESNPPQVTFMRTQPDPCRKIPHTVNISFSLKAIGSSDFTVENLFAPGPPMLESDGTGRGIVFQTHSWSAIANLQPPAPFSLSVKGKVNVPTPGYRADLKPAVPQGIDPSQLILDLVVTPLSGNWTQQLTDLLASYVDPKYGGGLKTVAIHYHGSPVAVIDVQEVH
ncbi:hypothetical protein DTL42_09140 [Bremerella cremea]|uniref:Uncharacterized protein n=1 Tax=Bremerella cremea TaxID=1031537 RepID=A0A368KX75_9BACT|nr:hypothetical protein [Bremerella cremea]RCS52969.1 hypothetical protein DTL42_09140 [Bremerella cremea]